MMYGCKQCYDGKVAFNDAVGCVYRKTGCWKDKAPENREPITPEKVSEYNKKIRDYIRGLL